MSIKDLTDALVDCGKELRDEGWYDLSEIQQSSQELQKLSRNGLFFRLAKLVSKGKLATKIVYDPCRSRNIRVWKAVDE